MLISIDVVLKYYFGKSENHTYVKYFSRSFKVSDIEWRKLSKVQENMCMFILIQTPYIQGVDLIISIFLMMIN